jgi:hypothetical protein
MAVCGTVVLVVLYYRSLTAFVSVLQTAGAAPGLNSLPIPFAITDGEGNIISISNTLLQMTKQSREAVEGGKITLLMPLDGESINLEGKEWKVIQSHMPDGRYYFQLEEAQSPLFSAIPLPAGSAADPATNLYDRAYAARCTGEEMYRIRRYKRWMSTALLRMTFQGENQPEKEEEIFNAYCRFVSANIRETDTACLVAPRDIYVLMPETQLEGARVAVSKLTDFVPHVEEQLRGFDGAADILDKTLFLGASSGELSFEEILEKLNSALGEPEPS